MIESRSNAFQRLQSEISEDSTARCYVRLSVIFMKNLSKPKGSKNLSRLKQNDYKMK